jgi:WG containing repeat
MRFPKRLFLFFFLLTNSFLYAQYERIRTVLPGYPHVVKDNIACLYGLKNDSGEWVVKPQYNELEFESGQLVYIASKGEKQGVLDASGKIIVPILYDKINAIGDWKKCFFIAQKEAGYGLLNQKGETVFPFLYQTIVPIHLHSEYSHLSFILFDGNLYSIMDQSGKTIVAPTENQLIEPDYICHYKFGIHYTKEKMIYGERVGYGDSTGIRIPPVYKNIVCLHTLKFLLVTDAKTSLHGIVNEAGDTIVPIRYLHIWEDEYKEHRFLALQKGNRIGVYDSIGRVIIPDNTQFQLPNANYYDYYFTFGKNDTLPARRDQKWGYLKGDGTWITAQIYDSIFYPQLYGQYNSIGNMVKLNGKYGLLNYKGKMIIPIEYDTLIQLSGYRREDDYSRHPDKNSLYIATKNDKYGMVNNAGKVTIPFIHDTIFATYYTDKYSDHPIPNYFVGNIYFTNSDSITMFNRHEAEYYYKTAPSVTRFHYYFKANDSILIYRGDGYISFTKFLLGKKFVLKPCLQVIAVPAPYNYENQMMVYSEAWQDTSYFDKNGKPSQNLFKGLTIVGYYNENLVFKNKEGKYGIISSEGKIVKPAIYYGFQSPNTKYMIQEDYVWIKFKPDTTCPFYNSEQPDCACGWQLCNASLNPICKEIFDYPFVINTDLQPMYSNGKAGLFSLSKHRYIVPPRYPDIANIWLNPYQEENGYWNISKNYFLIRPNGQFGLIDGDGNWLTDSSFNYMIPIAKRTNAFDSKRTDTYQERRWLLIGDSSRVVIDENGLVEKDPVWIDSLILQSNVLYDYRGDHMREYIRRDNDPYFGPILDFYQYKPSLSNEDSASIQALRFTSAYLLEQYEYRCRVVPASGYFTYFETSRDLNQYKNTRSTKYQSPQQHLIVSVLFSDENCLSLNFNFNPDTANSTIAGYPWYNLNYRKTATGYSPVTLDSIFCPNVEYPIVLNKLLLEAITKRDDLFLDCGNSDFYFGRTYGRFIFSKEGLVFFLDNKGFQNYNAAKITIPWTKLQPYSRPGGLIDQILGNSLTEHCRPAYDTTAIDLQFEKFTDLKSLLYSDYLKRNKVISFRYLVNDSATQLTGIRFCCENRTVYEVYFTEAISSEEMQTKSSYLYSEKVFIPNRIKKQKLLKMYSIWYYPCE